MIRLIIIPAVSIMFFSSCMSMMGIRPFVVREGGVAPAAGDTIAVISGSNSEHSILLADLIGKELVKNSSFKVMEQKTFAKILGAYPRNIRGPFHAEFTDYKKDFTNTDLAEILRIQKRLGFKYLWVLWVPLEKRQTSNFYMRGSGSMMYSVDEFVYVMGQLFERSNGKDVAYSDLYVNCSPSGIGISMIGTRMPTSRKEAVEHLSRYISDTMIEKTGMVKMK
ncbi:MAG TPA: hypothetical protein PLM53_07480 [Spirochaetota bacterium]|nr:hypothetical protein [Spirochaetota bacterium]HPC42663.1 hypothetical protein [Spirochaetota bacterium]HPL18980.1 hypothetical protein [Spirochaetota bacterium]HQF07868.1 hypothetical protein [Spirochaetota bacterium]HQH96921.1 hypothetical protein [Spirochaetota bacterium]